MPMTTPVGSLNRQTNAEAPLVLSRRAAVKLAVVGLVGAAAGVTSLSVVTRFGAKARPRHRFLSDADADLLAEICNQIVPRDDIPGAGDAGAVEFIDRQLGGPYATHRNTYRIGLESVRQTCAQQYGKTFHDLSSPEKIAVLQALEGGKVPKALWRDPSAAAFFNVVLAHTMQSFYGSPRHGGNRDYVSYQMLGLEAPQVVGQNRYRSS